MLFWLSLAALTAIAMPFQDPAAAVAPVLGEEVFVVGHVDLTRADVPGFVRRMVGPLTDDQEIQGMLQAVGGWTDALKAAGARDLFVLFDLADMPGVPMVVVPLVGGADGQVIANALSGAGPNRPLSLTASETIRGTVVAGSRGAVARIRGARPALRPELAEAFAAGGKAAVRVVVIPSTTQRRAIEESMADLPPQLGGGPVTTLTQGLRWLSIALEIDPKPMLKAVALARDPEAAQALRKLVEDARETLEVASRSDPSLAWMATSISQVKPVDRGDRVTFEADLETTAELVAVPLRQAREAARRTQCTKNLKQIGLAMHNHHAAHNAFPPAYSVGKSGKPLLSWRVHILPYLEAKTLYDEFHLDEPWDSPHNKALISRMPRTYVCPSANRALAKDGKTTYLTIRGPSTMFPGGEGIKIQEITDGTSNTIMVVDANDDAAVFWTKPDDWEAAEEFHARGLFGHHPGGTNFGFGDGSVRFLKATITPKLLKALTTRNGGEVIGPRDE